MASYGLAPLSREYGGALSDLVAVPYADAMLVALPDGVHPAVAASASDNIPDGWRAVAPLLVEQPGAPVLVLGGADLLAHHTHKTVIVRPGLATTDSRTSLV